MGVGGEVFVVDGLWYGGIRCIGDCRWVRTMTTRGRTGSIARAILKWSLEEV